MRRGQSLWPRKSASKRSKAPKDPANPVEDFEQTATAVYLDRIGVLWFHPPNEGQRSIAMSAKMARHGLKKGCPDIWVLEPRKGYHGLIIELKRVKGGAVSPEQRDWLYNLNERGYLAVVCRGHAAAIRVIEEYLHGSKPLPLSASADPFS